ncbi:MAG TPA: L-threonylcarbamoyladenylate synthase [Candidatus Acidoferrales bacterium]|nr:L-threonylcarbamoyladenylate synthase [Candidatus Acidoferrales bacterium]
MNTEILPAHTPELFQKAVRRAAELLRAGQVIALPTETVYGLAANALDAQAVAKIFEIKARPSANPVIVHVADLPMAKRCARDFPPLAEQLAKAFWPGPLTLVLPRAEAIPKIVTAGGETVGIRWPSHPLIQAVIRECGFPLAAPSANLSNQISPTNAAHVQKQLHGKVPVIVDGGQSAVGIESSVLDLTVTPPQILRPGMIHAESFAAAGMPVVAHGLPSGTGAFKSPGQLKKHYSPKAKLLVLNWSSEDELKSKIQNLKFKTQNCHVIAYAGIPSGGPFAHVSVIPHDAEAFARAIYAELHRCDEEGAQVIVVEAPPVAPEWSGIADRLRRAAA